MHQTQPNPVQPTLELSEAVAKAIQWAKEAGKIALGQTTNRSVNYKSDESLLTKADTDIEKFLVTEIRAAYPDHNLISEEGAEHNNNSPYTWVIDPVDGTTSFTWGLSGWGITIGLLEEGQPILGVFYMPPLDDLTHAIRGGPLYWNNQSLNNTIRPDWNDKGFLAVNASAHKDFRIDYNNIPRIRALGSVGANLTYTARGSATAALIPKAYLWDLVAGALFIELAGGELRYLLSGLPIDYQAMLNRSLAPEPIIAGNRKILDELSKNISQRKELPPGPPKKTRPEPQIERGNTELPPDGEAVLKKMFLGYDRVVVKEDFSATGLSGGWVYRVDLLRGDNNPPELPVVVKFAFPGMIQRECFAFRNHVRHKWLWVAELRGGPVAKGDTLGGLCYSLAGGDVFTFESMCNYCQHADHEDITFLLKQILFKMMRRRTIRYSKVECNFSIRASYDAILPPNIMLEWCESVPEAEEALVISPDKLPTTPPKQGKYVQLEGFAVTKVGLRGNTSVTLNLPPEDKGTIRLREVPEVGRYQVNQQMPEITGVVARGGFYKNNNRLVIKFVALNPLPENLITITPDNVPAHPLKPGTPVYIEGFFITRVNERKQTISLGIPAPPRTGYVLRLTSVGDLTNCHINRVIPELTGKVTDTRDSRLRAEVKEAMGSTVDPTKPTITVADGVVLPNPLLAINTILNKVRDAKVGCIHGDLNLENIMAYHEAKDIVLIDFSEARQDHVLHDFLRLETEVVTKLIPKFLTEAGLLPEFIYFFYIQLHSTTFQPGMGKAQEPILQHEALKKAQIIIETIRRAAQEGLVGDQEDYFKQYYEGLLIYLLGALRFDNLNKIPGAKKVAFIGAATILYLLNSNGEIDWKHISQQAKDLLAG